MSDIKINFGTEKSTTTKTNKSAVVKIPKHSSKNSDDCTDTDDKTIEKKIIEEPDEEEQLKLMQEKYIKHMDDVVKQIKSMEWGETISVISDPTITQKDKRRIKYCSIIKIVRFKTYMFYGFGSKTILRYFMNKTADDPEYSYKKIVQILDGGKFYRRFMPIRSWKELWKAYEDEPISDRHLFELIRSDQPCKPYLDIEWPTNYPEDPRIEDYSDFIDKVKGDLIEVFKKRYKIKITSENIMITTSHSKSKASFHIVIDKQIKGKTVGFKTNRKGFPNSAWDLWVSLVDVDDGYGDVIDGAVYTSDREFRVLYSNKATEYRPIIPYNGGVAKLPKKNTLIPLKTKECLRYIITYAKSDDYHFIQTPEVPTKYLTAGKIYDINEPFIPKIYSDKTISHLMNLVRTVHRTAEYTGRSSDGKGWRFSYSDKDEQCYSGEYHDSNGFYVFKNEEKGYTYMKCMSGSCKGIRILERTKKQNPISNKKLFH